ncbi:MAG: hypothetical protein ACRD2W_22205 [Acidimicrobiales bacterium]
MTGRAPEPASQLMAIFSLGGLHMTRARPRAVRCTPGFLAMDGSRRVVLDPFPEKGMTGVLEDGYARLSRGDHEVASQPWTGPSVGKRRWTDLDLLVFAGMTLWTWIGLPLELHDQAGAVVELDVPSDWPATSRHHVLYRDEQGNVVRHEEGPLIHKLSAHCEFGGAVVATRRRTRAVRGVTVLWADVVAAAMHGKPLN